MEGKGDPTEWSHRVFEQRLPKMTKEEYNLIKKEKNE